MATSPALDASTWLATEGTLAQGPDESMSRQDVRQAFQSFVGQSFYSQLLGAMRKTVDKPAYFHGGRGEEVFRAQLDQILGEKMAQNNGSELADRWLELQFPSSRPR
jgi:hypothetical protein